jgi:hypothetical protein
VILNILAPEASKHDKNGPKKFYDEKQQLLQIARDCSASGQLSQKCEFQFSPFLHINNVILDD